MENYIDEPTFGASRMATLEWQSEDLSLEPTNPLSLQEVEYEDIKPEIFGDLLNLMDTDDACGCGEVTDEEFFTSFDIIKNSSLHFDLDERYNPVVWETIMTPSLPPFGIGVDFGTNSSSVAVFNNGTIEFEKSIPSFVAFTYDRRLFGEIAEITAKENISSTFYGVKRFIGRKFNDIPKKYEKSFPFLARQEFGDRAMMKLLEFEGNEKFFPEEITGSLLKKLKTDVENKYNRSITEAVITVPVSFLSRQRRALEFSAGIAGFENIILMDQPVAVALSYYGLQRTNKLKKINKNVFVISMGAGGCEVCILSINHSVITVVSTYEDSSLGGEDFDHNMVKHLIQPKFAKNKQFRTKLRLECQKHKEILFCPAKEANICLSTFDLATFNKQNEIIFEKVKYFLQKVISESKLNIQEVLLVGKSTKVTKIREIVSKLFVGKRIIDTSDLLSDRGSFLVAEGAALHATQMFPRNEQFGPFMSIQTYIPHTLSLYIRRSKIIIFPKYSKTSSSLKTIILTTQFHNAIKMYISVFEGEQEAKAANYLFCKYKIELIRAAPKGIPKIELTFKIDTKNKMSLRARELEMVTVPGAENNIYAHHLEVSEENIHEDWTDTDLMKARIREENLTEEDIRSKEED